MPLFSIPLSGLTASSTALSAISNNLANLNTVGYKSSRATFRDLFYQNVGSSGAGNPVQMGAGAAVGGISTNFTGGNVESTGVSTDVAIMGEGYFVLEKDGGYQFTRAGNFHVGPDGLLMSEEGQLVMGYPAVNGVVGQELGPLQVGKGQTSPPTATTELHMRTNLNGSANVPVGTKFNSPVMVYDSLGASHVLTFEFTKSAANEWDYDIKLPASETGGSGDPSIVGSGTLTFDENGQLESPATNVTFGVAGLANGAADMSLTWRLFDSASSGLITQVGAPSNTGSTGQNGFGSGTLKDFSINADGMIQGTFTNGKTRVLGQLVLANFANQQGLMREGHNNFSATLSSGAYVIGAPGTGGRGAVAGGALELSNVDIAREFTQLILAQRGFQANARAITTFDEITQETINLKR